MFNRTRVALSAAIALALVVGPASAASAATEPFVPSDSKTRAFMLNVVGSVLKGATPDKWRREILANQNRYDFGLESLDVALNGGQQMNGDYITNPSSYDDHVIRAYEEQLAGKNGSKPARPPATRAQKFEKVVGGVGGALAAVTSAQFGFSVGKGISEIIGYDPTAGLCEPNFEDGGLIATLTGTDCSALALAPEYVANSDFEPGVSWGTVCLPAGSPCWTPLDYALHTDGFDRKAVVTIGNSTATTATFGPFYMVLAPNSPGCTTSTSCRLSFNVTKETGNTIYQKAVEVWGAGSFTHSNGSSIGPFPWTDALPVVEGFANGATSEVVPGTEIPPDPERTLTCSITGTNGATYTETSLPYTEGGGSVATPTCPELPAGVTPQNYSVLENGPNGAVSLYDEPTTPEYQAWLQAFPQCSYGACAMDLLDLRSGTPVSCFDTGNACAEWFADPAKTTNYQCTNAGQPVVLNECYVYAVLFKPGQVEIGAPYADPETGIWSGGQSSPGASATLFGNTVQDPTRTRSCYGQGWAEFNPVEWIMQPVQCAIEWAFVPRQAVVALELAKANEAWETTPPGTVAAVVGTWTVDVGLDGCGGVPLTWRGDTVQMLDACPGTPLAPIASMSHLLSGVLFGIAGIWAVINIVASVIGYRGLTVAGGNT